MIVDLFVPPEENIYYEDVLKIKEMFKEMGFPVDFISVFTSFNEEKYLKRLDEKGGSTEQYRRRRAELEN